MVTLNNVLDLVKSGTMYEDYPLPSEKEEYRVIARPVNVMLSTGQVLIIKPGFIWDESSVPWLFQPVFPKSGIYAPSALIHDALYYHTGTSQHFADKEYVKWMLATNVKPAQIRWRWWAVEKFGKGWWERNLKNPTQRCVHNRKHITLH